MPLTGCIGNTNPATGRKRAASNARVTLITALEQFFASPDPFVTVFVQRHTLQLLIECSVRAFHLSIRTARDALRVGALRVS